MESNSARAAGNPPPVPTAARREQIKHPRARTVCDCGAAELLDYVEYLESELVRVTRKLETLEARLSRNPCIARFRPGQ